MQSQHRTWSWAFSGCALSIVVSITSALIIDSQMPAVVVRAPGNVDRVNGVIQTQVDSMEAPTIAGSKPEMNTSPSVSIRANDSPNNGTTGESQPSEVALPKGDIERGRALFLGEKGSCSVCHAVSRTGEPSGTKIGPDLAGVGGRLNRSALIESIAQPSTVITKGFESWILELDSGEVATGLIQQESENAIVLIGPDRQVRKISLAEIEGRRVSPLSLMPLGLEKAFTPTEWNDLLSFLETLR